MGKKYVLLKDEDAIKMWERPMDYCGRKLYRIRALEDFSNVKAGDLGGYIESEFNLSQNGNCWIDRNCKAYEGASVMDNARVKGAAELSGTTLVRENAIIDGMIIAVSSTFEWNSFITGKLMLKNCFTTGDSKVTGDGCAIHLRAEGASEVTISGFNHEVIRNAPKAIS